MSEQRFVVSTSIVVICHQVYGQKYMSQRCPNNNVESNSRRCQRLNFGMGKQKDKSTWKRLAKAFLLLDVVMLTTRTKNTFENSGNSSRSDIAFVWKFLARKKKWQICEIYIHSDHQALVIDVGNNNKCQRRIERPQKVQSSGWNLFTIQIYEELSNSTDTN